MERETLTHGFTVGDLVWHTAPKQESHGLVFEWQL